MIKVTNELGTWEASFFEMDLAIARHLPNSVNGLREVYATWKGCTPGDLKGINTVTELLVMLVKSR